MDQQKIVDSNVFHQCQRDVFSHLAQGDGGHIGRFIDRYDFCGYCQAHDYPPINAS